ncbi:MAG: hypothetical protein ACRCY8_10275 [Dermatophilaceae bacterium]
MSFTTVDRLPQHCGQPVVPARVLAVESRIDELVVQRRTGRELGGVDPVAGLFRELGEEHELRAGVALSEAMDDVDLAPALRELVGELGRLEAVEQILIASLAYSASAAAVKCGPAP